MTRACLIAAFAFSLVAVAPSLAQAADDSTTRKKVQTYLDLAADLFKSGDFEGALSELRRAEGLSDLAVVRFNIGRCLEELHRDAEAVGAYQKYLALEDATAGAADRKKRATEAVTRLAAAPKEVGTLEVACPVAGTHVLVLGLMQAPVPCPWKSERIPVGDYDVQTTTPGQAPQTVRAQVAPGRTTAVLAQSGAVPQPALPTVASVSSSAAPVLVKFLPARSDDQMKVSIDQSNELSCQAPCELMLTPGRHRVEVSGAASYSDRIEVPKGPAVAKMGRRKGLWLGVGLGSLGVGIPVALVGLAGLADSTLGLRANPSLALLGVGSAVAVAGGIIGFKLKGSNDVQVARERTAERLTFAPELVALGVAPTPKGGGLIGATVSF